MSATGKSKFQGRAQDYLDWFKLGYETENKIILPPAMKVEPVISPSQLNQEQKVAKIPDYKKNNLGKAYAQKYRAKHMQEFQNSSSRLASVISKRRSTSEGLEDISTVADSDGEISSDELDTESQSVQVYLHYDFSHYNDKASELPVHEWKKEILEKIHNYSVVIVEGKTGCGKSTQVPQFILDNAYTNNQHVNIVVTQPRKIAAISLAKRVCDERKWNCGKLVGFQVGLNNMTDLDTRLSFVTTEVLVQKIIKKRSLNDYTHIIVDEVHERDEHTDFVLLLIKKLLYTVSRTIKIILMSATIDCNKFARYFATPVMGSLIPAPIIKVSDEYVHKLQIFYLAALKAACPLKKIPFYDRHNPGISPEMYQLAVSVIRFFDDFERQEQSLTDMEYHPVKKGSVLVFLPGLHEIENLIELMKQDENDKYQWLCLPLHSTLTLDEQQNVFLDHHGSYRKVIVSTNIAESSITVPDIKYVIDFCLTKTLQCDPVTNYTCLKLAWASKASCSQRAGRAGRVSSGRVYRFVDEEFYQELEAYITPELCRTPLTQAVLKTKLLDMGPPESLLALALDPPNLNEIYRTILVLKQVGALGLKVDGHVSNIDGNLTNLGRVAANLPLDPHLSKLIVLGHIFGCLEETVIIAASLSLKSFHSTPFQDELTAFLSKISWAYGSFSDCLASYHTYRAWQLHKDRGTFMPLKSGKEKDWARKSYIQIEALKDVDKLISEIYQRLRNMQIQPYRNINDSEETRQLILKICIAGAFFPNYFKRSAPDDYEKRITTDLSSHDPFTTVVVSGLPAESNILYDHQLKEMFRGCSDDMSIYYEGRKAYIQFPRGNQRAKKKSEHFSEIPGDFPIAMYLAIKMRQVKRLRETLVLKLYSIEDTKKLMDNIIIEGSDSTHCGFSYLKNKKSMISIDSIRKRIVQQPKTEFKPPEMPHPSKASAFWDITVTYVKNPDHFWVSSNQELLKKRINIETLIDFVIKEPIAITVEDLNKHTACLAPFEIDGVEQYYRAKVEDVFKNGEVDNAVVYFVDYGNTATVPVSKLVQASPEVLEMPSLAIECALSEVKPVLNEPAGTGWSEKCICWLKWKILDLNFKAQIYSVVHNVVRLELHDLTIRHTINEMLIISGFAIKSQESLVSQQNHQLRHQFGREIANPKGLTLASAFSTVSLDIRSESSYRPKAQLYEQLFGPHSPLEMNFVALSRVGCCKRVGLERNSVNSAALDLTPDSPCDSMIVSSFVVLNPSGSSVTLRNNTVMPSVPGILSLCLLLFAPVAELKVNDSKTAYTGAIFGLGFESETGSAIYPDDDIEVAFDFKFTEDDLREVNVIRYLMSSALDDLDEISPKSLSKFQKNLRLKVTAFLKKREYREPASIALSYKWNQIPEDYILYPATQTGLETKDDIVFPLHPGVRLEEENSRQTICEKVQHLRKLESRLLAEKAAPETFINEACPICDDVKLECLFALRQHLMTPSHTSVEWQLLTEANE